ncbi:MULTISPECIES: LuxR C-terminal-related transcriptional regulator [unclassified Leucobacter]|uniref:helix-turn-helix transcriptional regulator n=1 Tax=unclassified Leucobacter TaxID=2621730 RepID=UPI00269D8092
MGDLDALLGKASEAPPDGVRFGPEPWWRRKAGETVLGRDQELERVVRVLMAGRSVDVVGSRGSGRTTFLNELQSRLEEEGWNVLPVRGIASLKAHPLASLNLSTFLGAEPRSQAAGLQETARAIRARLQQPRSVVVIDDWDDLDEASWGVLEAVRRDSGQLVELPVVLTRLRGMHSGQTPSGLVTSAVDASYLLDLDPLRFEYLEQTIERRLGGPVEAETMSRIYAKSGSNVGLALALVDATAEEGRLRFVEGEWSSDGDLWSSALRDVIEMHLENLAPAARDSLEIIAMTGAIDVGTVRKLVDWETLEHLEERGMVVFVPGATSNLVTVVPPLLVEYFRHEPLSARRIRLTELIVERLGGSGSATAMIAERFSPQVMQQDHVSMFAGLLRERERAQRIVAGFEWDSQPSAETAVRYLRVLVQGRSAAVQTAVRKLLADSAGISGDPESLAVLRVLHAEWVGHVDGSFDEAMRLLREDREALGVYERLLDAAEVRIRISLETVPKDAGELLEVTEDLPNRVQLDLLETQMLVLTSRCRFSDAERVYAEIQALGPNLDRWRPRVLRGIALVAQGRPEDGRRVLERGLREARSYLNTEAFWGFGASLMLCHLLTGDETALGELLELLHGAGEPIPTPPGRKLMLLTASSITAANRGQMGLVKRNLKEVSALENPDGPFPGESAAWTRVQALVLAGKPQKAAEVLWDAGRVLVQRGSVFAGVHAGLVAIEIEPGPERLEAVLADLARLPEATALQAQGRYAAALVSEDPDDMESSGDELRDLGALGLAVAAYRHAERWFVARGRSDAQDRVQDSAQETLSRAGGAKLDSARFNTTDQNLSKREREVATLAAAGLSNQEIAARLVLSVRTVESHMHRIMRKLQISSRSALPQVL